FPNQSHGRAARVTAMRTLRYVALCHEDFGDPHFDVMFETSEGSDLATWRAMTWPPKCGDFWQELGQHRRAYLDYEGRVSGDRGTVTRIATGTHSLLAHSPDRFAITSREGLELELIRSEGELWRCVVNVM